jgi:hypothetical protein
VVADLSVRLGTQGASVEVSGLKRAAVLSRDINFAPLTLLVAVWIFLMKRLSNKNIRQ